METVYRAIAQAIDPNAQEYIRKHAANKEHY
jgi:adenosyl cobinamide kinase/adenosyl cobinamide phosphate guanylyltransferase